jgi:mannosylglycoprotein endo-beta-mannosidase
MSSYDGHGGEYVWKMKKADEIHSKTEDISTSKVSTDDWMPAIVRGLC